MHVGIFPAAPRTPRYRRRMVEEIPEMPEGTLGFRLSGKIDRDEYFKMLDPIKEKLERGERVSFLVEALDDFHGLDLGALWEDLKVAGSVGLKYRSSWERLAVVTDKDWMRQGIAAFAWVIPGEIRVFEPGELERAKAWVGGAG
jgi:SpoIIAA-like